MFEGAQAMGRGLVAAVALLAGCAAIAAGCSSDEGTAGSTSAVDCSSSPPPGPGATVLGRVRLLGYGVGELPIGSELQSGRNGSGGRFSKLAIAVKGDAPVVLTVPAKAAATVDLQGWQPSSGDRRADRIRVVPEFEAACAANRWIPYPGGFDFTRPQCLRLLIEADGRRRTVPFGLGRPC
jgi:hypothetical protein